MKQSIFFFVALAAIIPFAANAQSITIGAIPASTFCGGDSISVSFTVAGFWQHKNAFTLQLSDPTGSFTSNFTNLNSIKDTLPGTFTIRDTIPGNLLGSTHYRFRIMGALPYTVSADNGSDIAIGSVPRPQLYFGDTLEAVGTPIEFSGYGDSLSFDFGSGATPATAAGSGILGDTVRYSTGGLKTITLRDVGIGGCSATVTATIRVFDCTPPVIPHDAIVINNDTVISGGELRNFWVNPGVKASFTRGDENTIFAESGSTVTMQQLGDIVYLKPGAALQGSEYGGIVIYAAGTSVGNASTSLSCPTLDFDYTNAPPNAAMPAAVNAPAAPLAITLVPNPTNGSVVVNGLPSNAREITVENVLGQQVMQLSNPGGPELTMDFSSLPRGSYYLRFASGERVTTEKIVRQ